MVSLQENGWIVLRCLAEDIAEQLDALLDDIIRLLTANKKFSVAQPPGKHFQQG
jgi:very-short-patch-repair endonuclease